MSNNHLIIGLGGTGGKVIKAFRKSVYEEFRNIEPVGADGRHLPIYVSHLYVDSSTTDLAASEAWRTQDDIGPLIDLKERNRLSIAHNDLQTRLRDPEHFMVTHRYIGNLALWTDIFSQMNVQQAAGGQMRRLGEALFEPQCQAFVERVMALSNELAEGSGIKGASFHVSCGLAGGTGAGAFLHVIAQLRAAFPNARDFPIFLYLLLPDQDSDWATNGERTNYYANGYAALVELNAYLLSDPREGPNKGGPLFAPYDLTGRTWRFENLAAGDRTKLLDRLQGCFVLSNVNERNLVIGVKNEEIHGLIAQMVFQRIFLIDSAEAGQYRALRDAITLENIVTDDEGQATDPNNKVRSVRFLTFGLKRLIVPEEEIREHFSASFASQAALQMLYNNWPAETATAFIGERKNTTFKPDVQKEDLLDAWKLGDAHVTLSKGILATEINNKRWRPLEQDWQDVTPHLKQDAWAVPKQDRLDPRLDELEKLFQQRYDETFRGLGVEKFYETAGRDLRLPERHIAEICETLENWMFQEWLDGRLSVSELEVFLDDLLEHLEIRLGKIPARLENITSQLGKLAEAVDGNSQRWAKVGMMGDWLGKRANLFDAQAEAFTKTFEKRTQHQAWSFAEKLLRQLIAELRDRLRPEVAAFRTGLASINEFFQQRIDQTCQDSRQTAVEAANVVKFYEPDKVRQFCRSLLELQHQQRSWAGVLRRKSVEAAKEHKRRMNGREKRFAMMVAHFIKSHDARRVFEDVSRQNAEQAHSEKTGPSNRYFGSNIVTKLAEQFTDKEKLGAYVKTLVQSALTFMQWRNVEFGGSTGPNSMLAVMLPKCEERNAFREDLKTLFKSMVGGGKVEIIDSGNRPNEICLIAFKYAFPLRWLNPAWYLKERYDYRLSKGRDRALLEVHIEDHRPELPSLFRPAPGEAGKLILPWLQLAAALNLFERGFNQATGEQERLLVLEDAVGLPVSHYFPDSLIALFELPAQPAKATAVINGVIERITQHQLEAAQARVRGELAAEKYKLAAEREALKQKLKSQGEAALQNRDNNRRDAIYERVLDSIRAAIGHVDAVR